MLKRLGFILLITVLPLTLALILAEYVTKKQEKFRRAHVFDYGSVVKQNDKLGKGGFLKESLTTYVTNGIGSTVRWTNNSAGFRNDQEFSPEPPPGTLRILSLGDSFTAGYRVGQQETFSFLLEQWVNQHVGKSEVMVSEIEEPATALYYLNKFGLSYHPHIVLLGITLGNDIAQSYLTKEKYSLEVGNNGVTIERKPTKFVAQNYAIPKTYLQQQSYLQNKLHDFRRWFSKLWLIRGLFKNSEGIVSYFNVEPPKIFDYCNGLGVFMNPSPPPIEEAYQRLFEIIMGFQKVCLRHDIVFAVQLFPQRFQVQPLDWESAADKYRLKKSGFDLMGPNKRIRQFCLEHNIIVIDPTQDMARRYAITGKKMYLPFGDMHWDKEGHRAFFECSLPTFAELVQKGFQEVRASDPKAVPRNKIPSGPIGHKPESIISGIPSAGRS